VPRPWKLFAAVFRSIEAGGAEKTTYRAQPAAPRAMTAALQERLQKSVRKTLRGRLVGGASALAPPNPSSR
jgi:hypothetical protein